jgi:hypothetical protein
MADNIYTLPETYGPMLRDFYASLLRQPMPQKLEDLLAKYEALSAQTEVGALSAADTGTQPAPDAPAGGEPER